MIGTVERLREIYDTFRSSWNGTCDWCHGSLQKSFRCWYWVSDSVAPIMHFPCFLQWRAGLEPNDPHRVDAAFLAKLEELRAELGEKLWAEPDRTIAKPGRVRETTGAQQSDPLSAIGTFRDYVPDSWDGVSDATTQLNGLYDSISIWEIYRRLLPNHPHGTYNATGDTRCACPHESGVNSLSMSINDTKGVFFCFHNWEGGNKMALYCEIRGLSNDPRNFHHLKRFMVWEFRHVNPYAEVEE